MVLRPKAYRLSRRAEADLESIYDFTRKTWSDKQADIHYRDLIAGFEDLASGHRIGRHAGLGDSIHKMPVGSHVVFYRVDEHRIDVIRILHRAMDVHRHLDP